LNFALTELSNAPSIDDFAQVDAALVMEAISKNKTYIDCGPKPLKQGLCSDSPVKDGNLFQGTFYLPSGGDRIVDNAERIISTPPRNLDQDEEKFGCLRSNLDFEKVIFPGAAAILMLDHTDPDAMSFLPPALRAVASAYQNMKFTNLGDEVDWIHARILSQQTLTLEDRLLIFPRLPKVIQSSLLRSHKPRKSLTTLPQLSVPESDPLKA
jgi:hypothetical protein